MCQCPGSILGRTWATVLAATIRKRGCSQSKRHRNSGVRHESPCGQQFLAARRHSPQPYNQRHQIYRTWRRHSDRLPTQGSGNQDRRIRHGHRYCGRPVASKSSTHLRASLRNAAMVWASGSLSFVMHLMCSVTGSKFDPLWAKGHFSRSTCRLPPHRTQVKVAQKGNLRTARKQTCDLYVGVIPGPTPFMLDLTVKIR